MYDEDSSLAQAPPILVNLENGAAATVELNELKLKTMLTKYYSYPADHRKQIWAYLLHLPRNQALFDALMARPRLPQAVKLCQEKKCTKRATSLFNALIHWHAPLMNCEYMPALVQKMDTAFGTDPLFCFEVIVTFLVTFFADWLADVPGPPPDVLSRIDAILTNYDPDLRDSLGSGLVAWSAYRTCFAEVFYDRSWLEVMDVILSSSPQFLEYMVCGWLVLNGQQLRIDHTTFHSTRRPVNCDELVKLSLKVYKNTMASLKVGMSYRFIIKGEYPIIEAKNDAVVLRTLQGDYDKLAELQKQLQIERKKADDAERTKKRRQQTYDAITEMHKQREIEDRIATAKAAAELDHKMVQLRLEGKRLRQNEELLFIDSWKREWENGVDMTVQRMPKSSENADLIDERDVRMQTMMNLRQCDRFGRDARNVAVTRARHAMREVEGQMHETELSNEIRNIAANPALLINTADLKRRS